MATSPDQPTPPINRRVSFRIALIYAIAAGVYICFSDQFLVHLLGDATLQQLSSFQTAKGLAFVLASAMLIYFLAQRGISQVRSSETRAQRTRHQFASFMHNLPGVAFIKDSEGKYIFVNSALETMYPDSLHGGIGKTDEQIWPPATAREFRDNDRLVVERKQVLQTIEQVPQDGVIHYWLISKFPIDDEQGGVAIGGVGIDVTERVRSEQRIGTLNAELQRANRLKDDFLAVLSHELRTPITAIRLWSQLLRGGDAETGQQAIEMIEQSAAVQAQLIEDLLDVSRIVSGKLRIEPKAIDPAPSVQAAVNAVRPSAEEHNVRLEVQMPETPICAIADPRRLQQMTWNLLTNAIKFTPAGGHVTVRLDRHHGHLRLTVRDTGKGISPEFLPHMFEQFRQADPTTTRKHGGLGIGLAIVRHLVELHNGTCSAQSEGENKGATFTIELPLSPESPAIAPPTPPIPKGALAGLRILVAEDQLDTRLAIQALLKQAGAEVTAVASAGEALSAIRQSPPDVLLSDIGMPEEDGISLIRKLREWETGRRGRIGAGAVTAYAMPEDRERALRAGFDGYLVKPILADDLVRFVETLRTSART